MTFEPPEYEARQLALARNAQEHERCAAAERALGPPKRVNLQARRYQLEEKFAAVEATLELSADAAVQIYIEELRDSQQK